MGRWQYRKDGALCHLPLKKLRVSVPPVFLRAVESRCDGRTSWDELRRHLLVRWPWEEVDACLATLVESGLLQEAGHCLAAHARIGWTPQPFQAPLTDAGDLHALKEGVRERLRKPAPAPQLHPRGAGLMQMLSQRRSVRTFADQPLSLQSFVNVLWSAYGVVGEEARHVRRTVPSGGALHGLRWRVALLRPMDGHPTGLYAVEYHVGTAEGGALSLRRMPGEASQAWATLLMPAVLAFAHAVIYPVAELSFIAGKYGNRALTLAMVEAGHALQNAALAAQVEGAATIVRGDTVETEVLGLFALGEAHYPLPSLVVGAAPSVDDELRAEASHDRVLVRSVPRHTLRLPLSTRVAVAGPIRIDGRMRHGVLTAGRSADPRIAAVKAEAEGWERIGWAMPSILERARLGESDAQIDPRSLVSYSPAQYARADFPYAHLSSRRAYPWTRAIRAHDGAEVKVMAQCVYALSSLKAADARFPYTNASTSGVAAYTDRETAQCRAVIELIERDAFARAWLGRRPPPRLVEEGLCASAQARLKFLREAGYVVSVHGMEAVLLPAVAVFAQRASTAFTCVTTAAAFHFEEALDAALSEAESRIQHGHGQAPHPRMRPRDVRMATDHGDYFHAKAAFRGADWFVSSTARLTAADRRRKESKGVLSAAGLFDRLMEAGHEVLFCDLTPPGASIHQGRTPLHVARAFVPGLVPMWFGHGVEPAGAGRAVPIHPCT